MDDARGEGERHVANSPLAPPRVQYGEPGSDDGRGADLCGDHESAVITARRRERFVFVCKV